MKIISINLNKRLSNKTCKLQFEQWLKSISSDIILVQEPWPHQSKNPIQLENFNSLGGSTKLYSWIKNLIKRNCHFFDRFLATSNLKWYLP